MDNFINNLRDLSIPFRKKGIYHWQLRGSYSLKSVFPVLVSELSYQDIEIQDGDMAMQAYFMMQKSEDPKEI
ncbi:MAG: hypothetical protein KBE27_03305 [Syntrophorhabdaceae bacterium]|nr:hypothetical protein [Syntrophorhabdaceae bacterium]